MVPPIPKEKLTKEKMDHIWRRMKNADRLREKHAKDLGVILSFKGRKGKGLNEEEA